MLNEKIACTKILKSLKNAKKAFPTSSESLKGVFRPSFSVLATPLTMAVHSGDREVAVSHNKILMAGFVIQASTETNKYAYTIYF